MGLFVIISVLLLIWISVAFLLQWGYNLRYTNHEKFTSIEKFIYKLFNNSTNWCGGIIFAIIAIIAWICIVFGIFVQRERSYDEKIQNHYALKSLVESGTISEFEKIKIYEQIHSNNKTINQHRTWVGNWWTGKCYSQRIADLEWIN